MELEIPIVFITGADPVTASSVLEICMLRKISSGGRNGYMFSRVPESMVPSSPRCDMILGVRFWAHPSNRQAPHARQRVRWRRAPRPGILLLAL